MEKTIIASFEFIKEPLYFSLLIFPILGTVSNVLLLVAFVKDPLKCFRNSGTYLVMNLSVSDCLACLSYLFLHVHLKTVLIFQFFVRWLLSVSLVSITSISIDRFLIVAYPIKHRVLINGKVMVLWLAVIWTMSCVISAWTEFSESSTRITISVFHFFSMITILLSSVMYSSTYYKLKKQSRNVNLQNSNGSRAQVVRVLKEKRFLQTIIIIAFIAFVCVVPSMVFFLTISFVSFEFGHMAFLLALMLSSYLFQINLAVNPLIYFLRLPNYRKTFYAIYCRRRTASS